MSKLTNYSQCIQKLCRDYAQRRNVGDNQEVEIQTIFDREQNHYQLIYIGWQNEERIFGPVLHLDIKADKIWIQWNGTEEDVADELVKMGVDKDDIVIGFQPPYIRKYTEYAVG
ncbi:MAG: XisI protein [Oscillatoria sp. PMC 1068.18]|nr:XisI protein [Oscillatoria sp. PMC 1076.18]MEC4991037.1 XisI protein [Oscillatoria sp. PMC 1068.18]